MIYTSGGKQYRARYHLKPGIRVHLKPAIIYVSLNKNHHTPKGIIENGTFSINVPSADFVVETDYCGPVSGSTRMSLDSYAGIR